MMTQEVSPLMMFDQLRQSVQVSAKPTKKEAFLNAVLTGAAAGQTTRQLADACGESIYSARHWLLVLESEGKIEKCPSTRSSIWRAVGAASQEHAA